MTYFPGVEKVRFEGPTSDAPSPFATTTPIN
jgi:xylose isomerase